MSTEYKTDVNYEGTLKELEAIIEKMGSGELSLEDALKNFEKGVHLAKQCQQALTEAEQKVKILVSQTGDFKTEPFIEEQ